MPGNRINQQQSRQVAEDLWLHYYNRVLYENNIISEQERNRMAAMINDRKSRSAPNKSRGAR